MSDGKKNIFRPVTFLVDPPGQTYKRNVENAIPTGIISASAKQFYHSAYSSVANSRKP